MSSFWIYINEAQSTQIAFGNTVNDGQTNARIDIFCEFRNNEWDVLGKANDIFTKRPKLNQNIFHMIHFELPKIVAGKLWTYRVCALEFHVNNCAISSFKDRQFYQNKHSDRNAINLAHCSNTLWKLPCN